MIKDKYRSSNGFIAICECDWCGKKFEKRLCRANRSKNTFCGKDCFSKYQKEHHPRYWLGKKFSKGHIEKIVSKHKGKSNMWRGGKVKNMQGYILIYKPTHPNCDSRGYIREHHLVMEKEINRYLNKEEVVHHINGNREDNQIENLILFNNKSNHMKHHREVMLSCL